MEQVGGFVLRRALGDRDPVGLLLGAAGATPSKEAGFSGCRAISPQALGQQAHARSVEIDTDKGVGVRSGTQRTLSVPSWKCTGEKDRVSVTA